MNFKIVFIIIIALFGKSLCAQPQAGYYWVQFSDKEGTEYSLNNPEAFLSERSLQRRAKQNIELDNTDLPVSSVYVDSLKKIGFEFIHASKWLNACTVKTEDTSLLATLSNLAFVDSFQLSKPLLTNKSVIRKFENNDTIKYGDAYFQLKQLNGLPLHNDGFKGEGMQIAVLDNGFRNVNTIAAFDSLWNDNRVLAYKDFVEPGADVFTKGTHGTKVLSVMAANMPNEIVGVAPNASYFLFRTEDDNSEYIIEEDNWVVAAELADSLGVDIINSSLGYFLFDDTLTNHSYLDMDGKTTRVSRAASMAVEKGILVFSSAGNEANDEWKYLIAPSDGDLVVAVGAVTINGDRSAFSSFGPASDGDIKPNVSALGSGVFAVNERGTTELVSGTSFSSPLLAGMTSCLWQANPNASALLIKSAIEESSSQFATPDSLLGYGIPDFEKAHQLLNDANFTNKHKSINGVKVFPNPFTDQLNISVGTKLDNKFLRIQIIDLHGAVLYEKESSDKGLIVLNNLANLPVGILIIRLIGEGNIAEFKIVKR